MRRIPLLLAALFTCLAPVLAQRPILTIHVKGNERIPEASVVTLSGLRVGQVVTQPEMDEIALKLLHSGFFSAANYRCDPVKTGAASGFAVVLEVTEEDARSPVLLDIPGQDAERLWHDLMAADGLISRRIPDNEQAAAYYRQAVEGMLRKTDPRAEIVSLIEGKIGGAGSTVIFRPAHLPKIGAFEFVGNQGVPAAALRSALTKSGLGQDYTDYSFRRIAELNLRPVYEERGRLTVAFPAVRSAPVEGGTVTATVVIDEGPVWTLGGVNVTGEGVPVAEMLATAQFAVGAPANWKAFISALEGARPIFTRDGYLHAQFDPVRMFHDTDHVVDVTIGVKRGRQFRFGDLRLTGLDAATEQAVVPMWRLRAGDPMNAPYVGEYIREIWPRVRAHVKGVTQELHNREGTAVMDVTLAFK